MSAPRLIGFCGLAGAGKTTAAAALIARRGFASVRFADPLKNMLRALGLTEAELYGPGKEAPSPRLAGRTPRWAMQTLGEEWGRALIHRDLWISHWAARADATLAGGAPVLADDVRYPNEVRAIRDRGGKVVRVERPGIAKGEHASESLDPSTYDAIVVNSGDFATLDAEVERVLEWL